MKSAGILAAFDSIDFCFCKKILVAVSGGSDSTALLVGLHAYVQNLGLDCTIIAATIDHQLRPDSGAEAQSVAMLCDTLGVQHFIARWNHGGVKYGIQQKARMARYALLTQVADEQGVNLIVTGHTLDDQFETVSMRQKRGEGRGQAGIADATCYNRSYWFARPLLGLRREFLRETLLSKAIAWCDDPSNESDVFERVRVRKAGAMHQSLQTVCVAQERRNADVHAAAELVDDGALVLQIERENIAFQTALTVRDGGRLAFAALLTLVGEKAYFPNYGASDQALAFIAAKRKNTKLTLHGCLLSHQGDMIEVCREARHCSGGHVGFDKLVPCFDLALVNALYRRMGEPELPHLAFKRARC